MIGFFSLFKDNQNVVKNEEIRFVSIPNNLSADEIKVRFSKEALDFARFLDKRRIYLNYGKDEFIEYEYEV